MTRAHRFARFLPIVLLIGLFDGPGLACGPFFPDRILIEPGDAFVDLPYSTFSYEARQVPPPHEPPFRAVPPEVGEDETPGIAMARQTERIDLEELAKSLEATQSDPELRRNIVAEYTKVRQALSDHAQAVDSWMQSRWFGDGTSPAPTLGAVPAVPEGLPGEFADYLRGAIAYRQGDEAAARRAWQGLLGRPPEERPMRSTWAAYMLGRSHAGSDPARAADWFRQAAGLRG